MTLWALGIYFVIVLFLVTGMLWREPLSLYTQARTSI